MARVAIPCKSLRQVEPADGPYASLCGAKGGCEEGHIVNERQPSHAPRTSGRIVAQLFRILSEPEFSVQFETERCRDNTFQARQRIFLTRTGGGGGVTERRLRLAEPSRYLSFRTAIAAGVRGRPFLTQRDGRMSGITSADSDRTLAGDKPSGRRPARLRPGGAIVHFLMPILDDAILAASHPANRSFLYRHAAMCPRDGRMIS